MPKLKKKALKRRERAIRPAGSKGAEETRQAGSSGGSEVLDLSRYAIGTRLRHARLMRGARLKDVADAAQAVRRVCVSKIENNKFEPSLQVLHKLCAVMKIELGDLFSAAGRGRPGRDPRRTAHHCGDRRLAAAGSGSRMERVIPYAKGHLLQSNIHVVAPGGSSFGLISHEGEEVGYLIAGEIELYRRRQGLSPVGRRHFLLPLRTRARLSQYGRRRSTHSVRQHAAFF